MTGATLRRRADGGTELRVNGVFVMDDVETSSEEALAQSVLDLGARDILVGGLGLGFTLRTLLAGPVDRVVVAELQPEIPGWMRDGTIPGADLLDDPRTLVVLGDVRDVVEGLEPGSWDAIVLDVDNGPDFLVRAENATLYAPAFVAACARRLRPAGHLCIWSMAHSVELETALRGSFAQVASESIAVDLQGRSENYWIVTGSSPL